MLLKPKQQNHNYVFEAIGTRWSIDIHSTKHHADEVIKVIYAVIDAFDENYSRFRSDSLVTKMSRQAGTYRMPDDFSKMFYFYKKIYDASDGLVTPLIGNTLSDAGYDTSYSFKPKNPHSPHEWSDVLSYKNHTLTVKKPVLLDLGAAGKGYLIDLVANTLRDNGISQFVIDAGGDISVHNKTERIGLENPDNPNEVIGVIEIHNRALCGSAGNRRSWGQYHHILNPKTLSSPMHIKSVWTIADSTMLADGMSTCLFFVDPKKLTEKFNFEYLIMYSDRSVLKSEGFTAELFYE